MVEMIPTTINERWTLLLPEHRAARTEWPVWEKERLAAMSDCIRPGDVVYDIGAEEGDFPCLWASWGASVVLVEPNPRVWPNIKAIFEANQLDGRVLGVWVGFAGDPSTERFSVSWWEEHCARPDGDLWPKCAYGPGIGDHGFLGLPERPDCPSTTIDFMALHYGAPTVITIDVEGAELTVLRGANRALTENRPRVFVSVHQDLPFIDEKYPGDTEERVFEYMEALGYTGTRLALDHELHVEFAHPEGR